MISEPRELKPYEKAYKLKRKIENENMWIMGNYMNIAVLSALDKSFNGGKAKIEFPDKPFNFDEVSSDNKELTDDDKQKQINQLFTKLHIMKANFELNH